MRMMSCLGLIRYVQSRCYDMEAINSLISMYAKCGRMEEVWKAFELFSQINSKVGVIFPLLAFDLEFSAAKRHSIRVFAVLRGLLQIFLFICLFGSTTLLCSREASKGVFVGVILSMLLIVVKMKSLMKINGVNTLYRAKFMQDCIMGLFALLPISSTSGNLQVVLWKHRPSMFTGR
uniref:K(+) efflux antiporter 4-like n=1 Tax=Nicotiana tabacum TaxID=4097 RepID=A0A1S3XN20_TOBAC|nr:PREDICTED: K(+) efflux antiporter 4-like [Nicotiana tabacum]